MSRFTSLLIYIGIGFACLAIFEGASINWSSAWTYEWVLGWPIGLLFFFGKWILIFFAAVLALVGSFLLFEKIAGR